MYEKDDLVVRCHFQSAQKLTTLLRAAPTKEARWPFKYSKYLYSRYRTISSTSILHFQTHAYVSNDHNKSHDIGASFVHIHY